MSRLTSSEKVERAASHTAKDIVDKIIVDHKLEASVLDDLLYNGFFEESEFPVIEDAISDYLSRSGNEAALVRVLEEATGMNDKWVEKLLPDTARQWADIISRILPLLINRATEQEAVTA